MSSATEAQVERVAYDRLWWVGLLAVIASVAINVIFGSLAASAFQVPPTFAPLTAPQIIFLTVFGVGGAAVVYGFIGRRAQQPIRAFRRVALIVLVLSWLPDIGLLIAQPYPGTSILAVGALMVMHVIAYAISVGLLTTLARER